MNKRGRKMKSTFGVENTYVNTWAKINDEWVHIGMSKKHIVGITSDDKYNYYISFGKEFKQEI